MDQSRERQGERSRSTGNLNHQAEGPAAQIEWVFSIQTRTPSPSRFLALICSRALGSIHERSRLCRPMFGMGWMQDMRGGMLRLVPVASRPLPLVVVSFELHPRTITTSSAHPSTVPVFEFLSINSARGLKQQPRSLLEVLGRKQLMLQRGRTAERAGSRHLHASFSCSERSQAMS